jgi:hypothetical protein
MDISTLLVGGIPLIIVIFGVVEFAKSMGLAGRWLTVFSLALGLAFGVMYKIATSGLPVLFADWFTVAIFGLALGLVASGFYDFANKRIPAIPPEGK